MTDGDTPFRNAEPYVAPKPEGPEEISARMMLLRESTFERSRRKLLQKSGLGKLSPAKLLLIALLAAAEITLLALNFFTSLDIPGEWLLAPALSLPALILDRKNKRKKSPEATPNTPRPPQP